MACVSSMKKMGMEYVRCGKCHEITWCIGSITEGCAVCLKCANLSSDNIAKLEEALLWLLKRTMGRENRGVEGTNNG